jgi:hypothetical protein
MCLAITLRYFLWLSSAFGLEMRAKKILIDLILEKHPVLNTSDDTIITDTVFMNYNFSLDQLKNIHDGDLTDLRLAHREREVQKMELLVDSTNDKEKISKKELYTEADILERYTKQQEALRKLKEDYGLEEVRAPIMSQEDKALKEDNDFDDDKEWLELKSELFSPRVLAVVEQNRAGLCTFRWSMGKKPEFEYSGYQIKHNGQEQLTQKLQYNRMKKIKFEAQVKLEEGANSISVRMLFKEKVPTGVFRNVSRQNTRYSTGWSAEMDPKPIGPSPVTQRQDRILTYLNLSTTATGDVKSKETDGGLDPEHFQALFERARSWQSSIPDGTGGRLLLSEEEERLKTAGEKLIAQRNETAQKGNNIKGPPAAVRERLNVIRQSPFILTPSISQAFAGSNQVLQMNLGENYIYHDPNQTGPHSAYCIIHAYLKRILITPTVRNSVMLLSPPAVVEDAPAPARGFKPVRKEGERTLLERGKQYSGSVGERILFLDSGFEYLVGRQIAQRIPGKFRDQTRASSKACTEKPYSSVELYMTIASPFETFMPKSLVQRAQFQLLFCDEIASSLKISKHQVEFIASYPVSAPASYAADDGSNMTEIVFLLCDAALEATHRTAHLAPRILAAELAALVAMPESPLLKCLTLRNALGLRIKVGGRLASCGSRYDGDSMDGTSTVSTISEHGSGSDNDIESKDPNDMDFGHVSMTNESQHLQYQKGASHPLRTVEGRLATFAGWSMEDKVNGRRAATAGLSLALSPLALARAGFYRIDDPDHFHTVRCAYCRIEMTKLQHGDPPPMYMHKQGAPTCPMVLGTANENVGISFHSSHSGYEGKEDSKSGAGDANHLFEKRPAQV